MRNPNGYGCVYKLSGKRRKPFAVRITVGWELGEDGRSRQRYKHLGSYATQAEALKALSAYNDDPHALPDASTFAQVYERWSAEKFEKVSESAITGYRVAFSHCKPIHDVKFVDIRKNHMQTIVDKHKGGYHSKEKIKTLFVQLYKYALENDLVAKDYSKFVTLSRPDEPTTRRPFTNEEIALLWQKVEAVPNVDLILILIYTGWRIGELLNMETTSVDLENWTMRGGSKTAAGKNRVVPIHTRIRPLVAARYDPAQKYLVWRSDKPNRPITHAHFLESMFNPALELCGIPKHVPHECRHTCATLLDNAGANRVSIKRILGHTSTDVTDAVYTHKDIEELRRAIELIS